MDKVELAMGLKVYTAVFFQLLSSAGIAGAIVWFTRSWMSEHIKNSIRVEYDQKLKAFEAELKARYDTELETHKSRLQIEGNKEIESLKSQLSIAAAQREILFTSLNEKRAEIIAETYANLSHLHKTLKDYTAIYEPAGTKPREERRDDVVDAYNRFTEYRSKQIYIPKHAYNSIKNIEEKINSRYHQFLFSVDLFKQQDTAKWLEIYNSVTGEIQAAREELETQFRHLLGDA